MKCAQYRPLLSSYVDEEALPEARAHVEAHLSTCAHCRALVDEYRRLRGSVRDLPLYQPDPQGRARLLAAMERLPSSGPEVPISRRAGVGPVRSRSPFAGWRLVGNLATGFAMLIVIGAAALIAGMMNRNISTASASPTVDPQVAARTTILPVPTGVRSIATAKLGGPQPTVVPGLTKVEAASPTAPSDIWTAEADPATHMVRDEAFGYRFAQPGGWWSVATTPVAGALARRMVAPPLTRDGEAPAYTVSIDVLSNTAGLTGSDVRGATGTLRAALTGWGEAGAEVTALAGTVAGMSGFSVSSGSGKTRRDSRYLLGGALIYRIVAQGAPDAKAAGASLDTIMTNFSPASAPPSPLGGEAVLFLHAGDLWTVESLDRGPRALTHSGLVRAFAFSPDGDRVALMLGKEGGGVAQTLAVLQLGDGAIEPVWPAQAVYAITWWNDKTLLALGTATDGNAGLYRFNLDTRDAGTLLLADDRFPAGADLPTASQLQVAPDQRWVSFLAGGRLFAVRPDGSAPHLLLPDTDPLLMVSDYAWLPPGDGASAGRLLLVTDHGLRQLNLPTGNRPAQPGLPAGLPNAGVQSLEVAPSGAVACLLNTPGTPTLTLSGGTSLSLPAVPTGSEVRWCPGGGCLFYQDGSPTATRLHLIDLDGRTLLEGPLDSAR